MPALATISPPSSWMRTSQGSSVLSRWLIRMVVRSRMSRSSASMIMASVLGSTELVGSSRMRMGASFRKARARARRWRSPPDRRMPRSPTWVSKPSGRRVTNSRALAGVRVVEPQQQAHQCGLARPGQARDAEACVRLDLEREVAEDRETVQIRKRDLAKGEGGGGAMRDRPRTWPLGDVLPLVEQREGPLGACQPGLYIGHPL